MMWAHARLKAEVKRLEKADKTRAQDISRLTIERDAARDRLAEAVRALEQAEQQLDYGQVNAAHRIIIRALEGG